MPHDAVGAADAQGEACAAATADVGVVSHLSTTAGPKCPCPHPYQDSSSAYVCGTSEDTGQQACPDGCQDAIDTLFSECDVAGWEQIKQNYEDSAKAYGCGGAAQTAPLFAALAAVANHFLN